MNQVTTEPKQKSSFPQFKKFSVIALITCGILLFFWKFFLESLLTGTIVEVVTAIAYPLNNSSNASRVSSAAPKEQLFQASGWIEPDPFPIRATSFYSGIVQEVHVLEGAKVSKNQIIVTLVDEDAQLELRKAKAELAQAAAEENAFIAEIELAKAKRETSVSWAGKEQALLDEHNDTLFRLEALPKGAVSLHEITQARFRKISQESILQAAKTQINEEDARIHLLKEQLKVQEQITASFQIALEIASLSLERTKVRSPVDGIVLRLLARPGGKLMLNMDKPDSSTAAILYEEGKLQARIDIPLSNVAHVFLEQSVSVSSSLLPDTNFAGVVTRILGEADLQRNTLQVKVSLKEPDIRLRPEMLCRAKFLGTKEVINGSSTGSLKVFAPEAVRNKNKPENQTLWVVAQNGNSAENREVTFGSEKKDGFIEVINGLRPGDQILIDPPPNLEPGDRLKFKVSP
ncbi:MAG: efflux RND transporter periplasmic adaptor subunit [Opitutae bacterium]